MNILFARFSAKLLWWKNSRLLICYGHLSACKVIILLRFCQSSLFTPISLAWRELRANQFSRGLTTPLMLLRVSSKKVSCNKLTFIAILIFWKPWNQGYKLLSCNATQLFRELSFHKHLPDKQKLPARIDTYMTNCH